MSETPIFGDSDQCRHIADRVQDITAEVKMLAYQVAACPDAVEEIVATWQREHAMSMTALELILRGAAERLDQRHSVHQRAQEKAEKTIATALRGMATSFDAAFDPRGEFVYLLWSQDGECLYVGQSTNVLARLGSHLGDRNKRPYVCSVSLIRCKGRVHMTKTEDRLIRQYQPPWNTIGIIDRALMETAL